MTNKLSPSYLFLHPSSDSFNSCPKYPSPTAFVGITHSLV